MKKLGLITLLSAFFLLALSGCGGQAPATDESVKLDGLWKVKLENRGFGFAEYGMRSLSFIRFNVKNNQVTLYHIGPRVDFAACAPGLSVFGPNKSLSIFFRPAGSRQQISTTYTYEFSGNDTVVLHDAYGRSVELDRASSLPEIYTCKKAEPEYKDMLVYKRLSGTNLMSGNGKLWYINSSKMPCSVDAASFDVDCDDAFNSYPYAFAMQSGDRWATDGVNTTVAKRINAAGTVVDTLSTGVKIETGAYAANRLWVAGYTDNDRYMLWRYNTDANPNEFEDQFYAYYPIVALTEYAGRLWGLIEYGTYLLVRFDDRGDVDKSYILPYPKNLPIGDTVNYVGLAALGENVYLLGEGSGSQLYLFKVVW